MHEDLIQPVVLCGGSGTRLWPISRESLPKQFVPIIDGKSLLQVTLERVASLQPALCIANHSHSFFVQEAMSSSKVRGQLLLEPAGRNTAAAMACAAILSEPNALLLFLPSDHYIPDTLEFLSTVKIGVTTALDGYIVTFGVTPSFPSSAYGYIQQGAALKADAPFKVGRFVEKPDSATAQSLILSGDYLWNAGIFLCSAATLKSALAFHAPDVLANCETAIQNATRDGDVISPSGDAFLSCRSESIDYAVMEHFDKVAVIPFGGQWSDVGSWNAVAELTEADSNGNRTQGQALLLETTNVYINASSRPVVAIGVSNLLVIDTPDALLISAKSHAEKVKLAVEQLNAMGCPQGRHHRRVVRPWGWFDSIEIGDRFQVKRIGVKPGASLSLQMHYHRAEHWIVVKGTAEITNGDSLALLTENESAYIPLGAKHRLRNPGKTMLEIIEVQSGSYLGEDDIVRFSDVYGRAQHHH